MPGVMPRTAVHNGSEERGLRLNILATVSNRPRGKGCRRYSGKSKGGCYGGNARPTIDESGSCPSDQWVKCKENSSYRSSFVMMSTLITE
jgi:hypothetical protein